MHLKQVFSLHEVPFAADVARIGCATSFAGRRARADALRPVACIRHFTLGTV